jgi:hypothetical protein
VGKTAAREGLVFLKGASYKLRGTTENFGKYSSLHFLFITLPLLDNRLYWAHLLACR